VDWLLTDFVRHINAGVVVCLLPLAFWILLSGLDDLVVLFAFLYAWRRGLPGKDPAAESAAKAVAIFVPCWHEHAVITDMVEHNLAVIRYDNFDFFIGAYPNDESTVEAVRALEYRFENVHLCMVPHKGPTSKADCMNWIYQGMLAYEDENGCRFDLVLIHDAEDLIHPEELRAVVAHSRDYDMIQIPVLPLPTPLREITHALYCDDFAEYHTKDFRARQALGGFVPSCGVGTGYTRDTLQRLAESESNLLFNPSCLTEDYENGLRLKQLGCRQLFLPITHSQGSLIATREFFPRTFRTAVKQRTRWVTGIALQGWEHHGWTNSPRQAYWLWRDRKGLIGSPASLLSNLLFVYGVTGWLIAQITGTVWGLGAALRMPGMLELLMVTFTLQTFHLTARTLCVARIYGTRFALGVPFRVLYGNLVNSLAALSAMHRYFRARLRGELLVWVKTDHAYPSRAALLSHKRPIEEILVGSNYISTNLLRLAQATKPDGVELTEYLREWDLLTEEQLYRALSLQTGLVMGELDPHRISLDVARIFPSRVAREWKVLPFRVEGGNLHVASPRLPSDALHSTLQKHTRLRIHVQLVTPTHFERLVKRLL
jgi:adsorption protein B